jgi:hypothetical protein
LTAPELGDRGVQALDLGRQRARAAPRLERVGQRRDVGVRFRELLGELSLGELRRLLLELHVLDLGARGLQLLVRREARLLACAQVRAQRFQTIARIRAAPAPPRRAPSSCSVSDASTGVQSMAARSLDSWSRRPRCSSRRVREIARAAAQAPRCGRCSGAPRSRLPACALGGAHFLAAARERTSASFRAWRADSRAASWSCIAD